MKIAEIKSRENQRTLMGLPYPQCEKLILNGHVSKAHSANTSEDRQYHSNVKIIYMSTIRKLFSFTMFKIDLCIGRSNKFTKQ